MGWRHLSQKEWAFLFGNQKRKIYYQSTLCRFGDRALMPYKLKLDILLRLFEKGELLSPFYYKTEGTEKSHHTAAKDYNTKTMRDGGNDAWNMSFSFPSTVQLI